MLDKDSIILENLYNNVILEQIYGNRGFVYHRTQYDPSNSDLIKLGITSSENRRAWYGKGLYCCYDLSSQMQAGMKESYGRYIIKGMIDLNGFAILDSSIYSKSNPNGNFKKHLEEIGTNYDNWKDTIPYSSQIAINIWENLKRKGYNGIVFNGQQDGKVAVIWNRSNFIPFKYTSDEGKTWQNLNPNISNIKRPYDLEYDFDEEKDNPVIGILHKTSQNLKNWTLEYDLTNIDENQIHVMALTHFDFDFSSVKMDLDELKYISGEIIESIISPRDREWYDHPADDVIVGNRILFDYHIYIDQTERDDVVRKLREFLDTLINLDKKWESQNQEFKLRMNSYIN